VQFNRVFNGLLNFYEAWVRRALLRPGLTVVALMALFVVSLGIYPLLGVAFFPRTDAGQFTVNLKAPTGSRLGVTDSYVAKVENLIRQTVGRDFKMVVSNIGMVSGFSALYTSNSGPYTATIQAELADRHQVSSFEYMERVRKAIASNFPELRTFVQSGSMVDATLNSGCRHPSTSR
jgi:multidrug efflux pump subunit AcrB